MRQSIAFPKTDRTPPKGEQSHNAMLLQQAGFIQKLFAGVYSYLPTGWKVIKKIENIIREEINAIGGQELFLPALHPKELYEQTGRDTIDVLFHLEMANGKKLVLGISHEEVIVPLVKQHIHSYKDLPLYLYQIQTKFRNELRAKSGILRGREFIMKDLYSFHTDEEDFKKYYERAKVAYNKIFDRVGLGASTHLTFASGGTFSEFSHEFQTITEAGEDIIHLCETCGIAVNDEIKDTHAACPKCGNTKLTKRKSIEVGNIFPLKDKFSSTFGLTYTAADGSERPIIMGCYGIGLGRVMGAVAEVHNDEHGLIWPESVSPYQVHLISIGTDAQVIRNADTVYRELQQQGIDVLYDDRDESAGVKFNDADLIGIPHRYIVSAKTKDKVEHVRRGEKNGVVRALSAMIKELK